jgi:hypothetical protein
MTDRHERLVSHRELFLLTLRCPKQECGAEVTLNLTNKVHVARLDADELQSCFVCRTAYDSRFREALVKLSEWYRLATASGQEILFRVVEAH